MATRAAAEDKARDLGSLYHQPTIKPGLGSSRCPRCFSPIPSDSVGTTAGGTLSAFHGFNKVMPFVQNRLRGPMWLHFFIGGVLYRLLPKFQFPHIMQHQLLHTTQCHSLPGVLKALLLVIIALEMNLANNMNRGHNVKTLIQKNLLVQIIRNPSIDMYYAWMIGLCMIILSTIYIKHLKSAQ